MQMLIVEDDPRVADVIQRGLQEEGYQVLVEKDGVAALQRALLEKPDFIILDMMLPRLDGLSVLRELRAKGITIPILILTARDELSDKVEGLNAGADDYLTKPFGFEELLARIRALLRRRGNLVNTILRVADLEIDTLSRRVNRAGESIVLTNREYALLEYLMRRPNQAVSRDELSNQLLEPGMRIASNLIDVHIGHLRRKIDDEYSDKLLQTVRGKGYCLRSELNTQ